MSQASQRFRLLSAVGNVELIAGGRGIRIRQFLMETYGGSHWRKMKGVARVENEDGWIGYAEIHWFEAHGVGKVLWKLKRKLEP
jgi:hypothetical protein